MNNIRRRLLSATKKDLVLYTKRFYPAGTYYWTVPEGCTEVDVFLVGGGGGAANGGGGGGGYTKTYKASTSGWRDDGAISVSPGETITIIVGSGGNGRDGSESDYGNQRGGDGGYSQFKNSSYRANGGGGGGGGFKSGCYGGNGGSGGGSYDAGGSDGEDGTGNPLTDGNYYGGSGQGHTTSDFGEGAYVNAGGGGGASSTGDPSGGYGYYSDGHGGDGQNMQINGNYGRGGGGYGGGGGACRTPNGTTAYGGNGGDGTVLIRYYAY